MNQILTTSMPKTVKEKVKQKEPRKPAEIRAVLRVFAFVLLIFGLGVSGIAGYSVLENTGALTREPVITRPTIQLQNKSENTVQIIVTSDVTLDTVSFAWNDEEPTIIERANRGNFLEEIIDIPSGFNTLHIFAVDINGMDQTFEKDYDIPSNINIANVNGRIRVTYEGNTEIAFMTFRWNDGEETRIEINSTEVNEEFDVPKGLNNLTVVLVDINNNSETMMQRVKGVARPTIDVQTDAYVFIVTATDEIGLSRIDLIPFGDPDRTYSVPATGREFETRVDLVQGENKLQVTVYNEDGLSSTIRVRFYKE